ncbi:NAD(P)H-dependent oxidoreductase [Nocardioides sp. TRM66260-LWL]|uniref:NADPH-dependent FMN reductase n=1 Tax=Nocardioides sp. TRM66260-LWL TaxID=2874478 RepID=UPI001CC79A57|nr:NAD(P)H-dependent oxidoreductase [Nocardioides sp. TRM66260-LWL]MBZ5734415.1 NAD(P)H-dependent oxidoreductase [Nocardioides sp. TRM66260-LWL]
MTSVAVVVGNPSPGSRTLAAATWLADQLAPGADDRLILDLAPLGPSLLAWDDAAVAQAVATVGEADLVVVASPTYKGTYTGLLKLFLDHVPGGTGIRGVAVPFMLCASPAHAHAAELLLRPVLTEFGASVPVRGLSVLDTRHDDPMAYADWLAVARPRITAALTAATAGARS